MPSATVDFPAGHADHPQVPAGLAERGLALRPALASDLPFLRRLYGQNRAAELAAMAWPTATGEAFLDSQFGLQHRHYVSHFADADFLVLEQHGDAVGRLYLQRAAPDFLIVDISLLAVVQGQGIGGELIASVQAMAAAKRCGIQLHVDRRNAGAQRLYLRLGFEPASLEGAHVRMRWSHAMTESVS